MNTTCVYIRTHVIAIYGNTCPLYQAAINLNGGVDRSMYVPGHTVPIVYRGTVPSVVFLCSRRFVPFTSFLRQVGRDHVSKGARLRTLLTLPLVHISIWTARVLVVDG